MWWRKLIPVALLGVLSVGYLLVRPSLREAVPHLHLIEFPVGLVLMGVLLLLALRRPRRERKEVAQAEWRRHEQVVRPVPDPEAERLARPLTEWVESGSGTEAAAAVLARLAGRDPAARERALAELVPQMRRATSKRARMSLLREQKRPRTPGA